MTTILTLIGAYHVIDFLLDFKAKDKKKKKKKKKKKRALKSAQDQTTMTEQASK